MELLKIIITSVVTFVVVIASYLFGIQQKRFDQKSDYQRRLRKSISDLLLIWKEFSHLQLLLHDTDKKNDLLFEMPEIAKSLLNMDLDKVRKIKASYEESLVNVKDVNTVLFFDITELSGYLDNVLNNVLLPIAEDNEISLKDKEKALLPIVNVAVSNLESGINQLAKELPKKERKQLDVKFKKHGEDLKGPSKIDIPVFVVDWLNKLYPLKTPILKEEFEKVWSNQTFKWAIHKLFIESKAYKLIFKWINPYEQIRLFLVPKTFNLNHVKNEEFERLLSRVAISEEEEKQHLQNNKDFYLLVLGFMKKTDSGNLMELKRILVKINNGTISFREEYWERLRKKYMWENLMADAKEVNSDEKPLKEPEEM